MVNGKHRGPGEPPQMQVKSPKVTLKTSLPTLRCSVSGSEAGVCVTQNGRERIFERLDSKYIIFSARYRGFS